MQSCDSGVVNKDAMPIGYGDVPCPRAILPVNSKKELIPYSQQSLAVLHQGGVVLWFRDDDAVGTGG